MRTSVTVAHTRQSLIILIFSTSQVENLAIYSLTSVEEKMHRERFDNIVQDVKKETRISSPSRGISSYK